VEGERSEGGRSGGGGFWGVSSIAFFLQKIDFQFKERVNNNLSLYAASFRRKLPIFLIK
jgi:hypothetical protein